MGPWPVVLGLPGEQGSQVGPQLELQLGSVLLLQEVAQLPLVLELGLELEELGQLVPVPSLVPATLPGISLPLDCVFPLPAALMLSTEQ